jgi:hypothetical protein
LRHWNSSSTTVSASRAACSPKNVNAASQL